MICMKHLFPVIVPHRKVAAFAAPLLLAACASLPGAGVDAPGVGMALSDARELPAPYGKDAFSDDRPYRVGPYDTLRIDVLGVPELSQRQAQADAGGRITFPLIGIVEAGGQTLSELSQTLEALLEEKYVRHPVVTVDLVQAASQTVTIDGAVNAPGIYPVVGKMTLMRAIAGAKGATASARMQRATIFRDVDNQKMAGVYNLLAIYRGNYVDPEVFAGDMIVVGNVEAKRIFKGVGGHNAARGGAGASSPAAPLIVSFEGDK
ncbi:MAG: polysaccharide export protein [Sphingobium sp.]|nr:MAG: polysaccharide export protein [Sphingobium sp.]